MTDFFAYLFKYFPYVAAVATTIFALRVSWDAYKMGASPVAAISRGVGMIVTFFFLINVLPYMFESGVASAYQRYQSGTVAKNLVSIGQGGVNLLVNARTDTAELDVPEAQPIAEFATETYDALAGSNDSSAPQSDAQSAPSVPSTNVEMAAPASAAPASAAPASAAPAAIFKGWDAVQPTPAQIGPPAPTAAPMGPPAQPVPDTFFKGWDAPQSNQIEEIKPLATVPAGGPQTYTVQFGDSMSKIASRLGVSLGAMCTANKSVVTNCNRLRVGQVLSIP